MVGTNLISKPAPWSDYVSLKKYLEHKYGSNKMRYRQTDITQTGTAGAVELEDNDSIAIGQIGKAEIAVSLGAAGDEATHNTVVFTLTYIDADGESHTATATGSAGLATTQVAFVPPITDFYAATSFTASADFDTQDVYVETTGSTAVWATITAAGTVTAATEAQLLGVGAIYGRSHTNHNDADGAILYLEYATPQGTIKFGHCTIDTTDGTTEVRFFEATATTTDILNDTLTATTTTVKDYYRTRRHWTNQTPTSNCHEHLITDAACSNVDGSGGDVYGVIKEGAYYEIFTRHYVLANSETYLANICGNVATNTDITLTITYTPFGAPASITRSFIIPDDTVFNLPLLFRCEPLTDISYTILGNSAVFCARIEILEASEVLA